MRLLLMNYSWIFACPFFAIGNGLDCDKLTETLVLEKDPKVCDPTSSLLLGHYGQFATVDFSKADNKVLNTFLQQFDAIQAGIVIENSNLDTINFGKIGEWNGKRLPENGTFISIRNNPKLTKFEWDSSVKQVKITTGQNDAYVFMYNNPLLNADTLNTIKAAVKNDENIKGHMQNVSNECWFEEPLDTKIYTPPIPEILKNCRSIKGDLILAGGTLKEKLKLSDNGCLKLTGVDMTGVTIEASPGQGVAVCKDGTTKSEVTGNLNLCGKELQKLVDYFSASSAVKIEMDTGTCTIDCKDVTEVADKYNYCKTITTPASIIDWFKNEALKEKLGHLVSSEELTISGGSMTKISLPKLTNAKGNASFEFSTVRLGLIIRDNGEVTDLELPALKTVTKLVIEGNPKLTLAKMNKALEKINPTTSTVECRLTADDVIKDFNELRLCTAVIGPLTLDGLKHVDPTKFNVKKVVGCVKIKDTQLRSLEFLNIDISGCTGQHLVTGSNLQLCKVDHLDSQKKIPVKFEGNYIKNCGKICASLNEDNCELLQGQLVFNGTIRPTAKMLKKLKIILGGLKIDKSPAESIDIPNLEEIQAPTAPALQITDNLALKSLSIKKIKNINATDGTTPRVKITGNKKLKLETLRRFLPSALYDQCLKKTASCEYEDGIEDGGSDGTSTLVIVLSVFCAIIILIVCGIGCFFLTRYWRDQRQDKLNDKCYNMVDEKALGGKLWKERKPRECYYYTFFQMAGSNGDEPGWPDVLVSDLTESGKEILYTIVTSLVKEDFLFWRCQFKGIPDIKISEEESKKALAPAMINEKMLLNKNVHLINSRYLDQWPAFLQTLIDNIEVIRGKNNSREPSGREKTKDDKPEPKEKTKNNCRTVHIIHVGAGFADSIEGIRLGPEEERERNKKNNQENIIRKKSGMQRKSNQRKITESAKSQKATSMKAPYPPEYISNLINNSATKNPTKSGEEPKKEEKPREKKTAPENRPKIHFIEHNRVKLSDVDGYCMFELTGALKFHKKNGKRQRLEVVVLEIIPLMMDKLDARDQWKEKKKTTMDPVVNGGHFPAAKHLFHSMKCGAKIPWPAIVDYALDENIIVHTEQADYYLLIYYFISTFEALSGVYGTPNPDHFSHFGHGIYHRYTHMLYKNQFNSGSANAWYIWATSMCNWFQMLVNCKDFESQQFTNYDMSGLYKNVGDIFNEQCENDLDKMEQFILLSLLKQKHVQENLMKKTEGTKMIRWAELYVQEPKPEHPLYAFVEKITPFDLPDKKLEYDTMEPLQVLLAKQKADGSQTRIITATKEKPLAKEDLQRADEANRITAGILVNWISM